MEITILQLLGAFLIVAGGQGIVTGEVPWSFEAGPGGSEADIDLTPKSLRLRRQGRFSGKWVRPVCGAVTAIGLLLVFILPGDSVVISL